MGLCGIRFLGGETERGGLCVEGVFGHSGNVVADGALKSLGGNLGLGLRRQVAGGFLVKTEEFFQSLDGLACGLVDLGVVVKVFE